MTASAVCSTSSGVENLRERFIQVGADMERVRALCVPFAEWRDAWARAIGFRLEDVRTPHQYRSLLPGIYELGTISGEAASISAGRIAKASDAYQVWQWKRHAENFAQQRREAKKQRRLKAEGSPKVSIFANLPPRCTSRKRPDESPIERKFAAAWPSNAPSIVPQYEIDSYRVDFAHVETRTAIELDGFEFHSSTVDIERDRKRQRALERSGWHVIRFGGREVHNDAAMCVREAVERIESRMGVRSAT